MLNALDKEFINQKRMGFECRHLKPLEIVEYEEIDFANDEVIGIKECKCSQCGQVLSESDLRKREKILNNFNQNL